jgi:death-on-curing protein
MDGNKRTAFQIADLILGSEGWFIHGEKDKIIGALLKIARYECDVDEIEKWLKGSTRQL